MQNRVLWYDSTCTSICPSTYFQNTSTDSCEACSDSCLECTGSSSACSSCPEPSLPYLLPSESTCYASCPSGYYPQASTSPKYCLQCDSVNKHCQSCSDFSSCDSCEDGYFLYLSQCYLTCPLLIAVANPYTNECDLCPDYCSSCQLSDSATFVVECTACENGYLLDISICVLDCLTVGYVPNNNQCSPCSDECLTCTGDINTCLTCDSSSQYRYFLTSSCL